MAENNDSKKKSTGTGTGVGKSVTRYFREVRGEVRKVTWPTRSEGVRLTGLVLLVTAVMTLILASFDWVFGRILAWSLDVIPGLF